MVGVRLRVGFVGLILEEGDRGVRIESEEGG